MASFLFRQGHTALKIDLTCVAIVALLSFLVIFDSTSLITFLCSRPVTHRYPIKYNTDPQDSDDANVPWLAPGRLLIFVKYEQPIDDTLNVTGEIDGRPLLVRKAYNTIVRNPGRFIGHWVSVFFCLFV
jgi:hypothetical protein